MKKRTPRQSPAPALLLGTLQEELVASTKNLCAAQRAKIKADENFASACENHEKAKIALNTGVTAVKNAAVVPNLYAA